MSGDPGSYRVPVLRLTDVSKDSGLPNISDGDDEFEFKKETPAPQQNSARFSSDDGVAGYARLPDEAPTPVAAYNARTPDPVPETFVQQAPAEPGPTPGVPYTNSAQVPPRNEDRAKIRAILPKPVDPFARPKPDEPPDIWEMATMKKSAPTPPQNAPAQPTPPPPPEPPKPTEPIQPPPPPPSPAPSPVSKPVEQPPQKQRTPAADVPIASAFTYGTQVPPAPPKEPGTLAAPIQPPAEEDLSVLLNQALESMEPAPRAPTPRSVSGSVAEAARGPATHMTIQPVADSLEEFGVPEKQPEQSRQNASSAPAQHDTPPTNVSSGVSNLAALRERVLRAGTHHTTEQKAEPSPEGPAAARARALAGHDIHAMQQAHTLANEGGDTPQAPIEEKHTPQTEHARALADVAERLRSMQQSDGLSGAPTPSQGAESVSTTPHEAATLMGVVPQEQPPTPSPVIPATPPPFPTTNEPLPPERKPRIPTAPPQRVGIPMIRTFKGDVERTINHDKVSVVKMISDQETQRHAAQETPVFRKTKRKHFTIGSSILVTLTLLLIGGAIALGIFLYGVAVRPDPTDTVNTLFFANDSFEHDVTKQDRTTLLQGLVKVRDTLALSPGQIMEIVLVERAGTTDTDAGQAVPITGKNLMQRLNARAPEPLIRTVKDSFVFGIHAVDTKEPFIVLNVGYQESAFSGMLLWEESMDTDLAPLFGTPVTRRTTNQETAPLAMPATTSPSTFIEPKPITVDTRDLGVFDDVTIANTPTRVLRNPDGSIHILWAMPDTGTIIITTNEQTYRELLTRMDER